MRITSKKRKVNGSKKEKAQAKHLYVLNRTREMQYE